MSDNLNGIVCRPTKRIADDVEFYRDRGFNVIPLDGKRPAKGVLWKQLMDRHATEEEIRMWFGGPPRNLGVVCGRISGVVALDADSKEAAAKLEHCLPKTDMITETARGAHFFSTFRLIT